MKNFLLVLAFTGLTALCWGVYGPVLRIGQADMGGSHLRPFICVGVAYFLIAIVVPGVSLRFKPSPVRPAAWPPTKPADSEDSSADKGSPKAKAASKDAASAHGQAERLSAKEMTLITLFVAMTALCWGVYGPVLHKGQMLM